MLDAHLDVQLMDSLLEIAATGDEGHPVDNLTDNDLTDNSLTDNHLRQLVSLGLISLRDQDGQTCAHANQAAWSVLEASMAAREAFTDVLSEMNRRHQDCGPESALHYLNAEVPRTLERHPFLPFWRAWIRLSFLFASGGDLDDILAELNTIENARAPSLERFRETAGHLRWLIETKTPPTDIPPERLAALEAAGLGPLLRGIALMLKASTLRDTAWLARISGSPEEAARLRRRADRAVEQAEAEYPQGAPHLQAQWQVATSTDVLLEALFDLQHWTPSRAVDRLQRDLATGVDRPASTVPRGLRPRWQEEWQSGVRTTAEYITDVAIMFQSAVSGDPPSNEAMDRLLVVASNLVDTLNRVAAPEHAVGAGRLAITSLLGQLDQMVRNLRVQPQAPQGRLDAETYRRIITTLGGVVRSMESSPRTYQEMGEEDLRQVVITALTASFSHAVTGETFHRAGKTDIIMKRGADALFIAECKIWHGPKTLADTITQVLGYLTVRDPRVAVIMFVRNKDFSRVQAAVLPTAQAHPGFVRELLDAPREMPVARFRHPDDASTHVDVALLTVHLPRRSYGDNDAQDHDPEDSRDATLAGVDSTD